MWPRDHVNPCHYEPGKVLRSLLFEKKMQLVEQKEWEMHIHR